MPDGPVKPVIFISYSHKDQPDHPQGGQVQWLDFVRTYLQPAIKHGVFDLFVDDQLKGGADLDLEIERKLRACDVFVLLISANSMASNYIIDTEIRITRERQKNGEDVVFYPVLLEYTPAVALEKYMDRLIRPRDLKPLLSHSYDERVRVMTEIADEIATIANGIARRRPPPPPPQQRRPSFVHILGLPETPYENLVGRDAELKRLDDAWKDGNANIVSLIAEGGAGKTALVNEWLKRLRADNYRGAEAVLGWSFYSQDTKKRATSADKLLSWAIAKLDIPLETASAIAKAEAIAEELMRRRVLLLLDGVEPLLHGIGPQLGLLEDQSLRALLRRFAMTPPAPAHGLIVLTSRLAIKDIARGGHGAAPVVDVGRLSDEAGARLLRDNGVWGTDKELGEAAHDFGGHALALGLLASFLKETQIGDVRRRDHIRDYFEDTENPRHDHARRVMESYEKEWLAGKPDLLAIMYIVGLFDRPASGDCLDALRARPAIEGLTEPIVDLDDAAWQRCVAHLREVRLLVPKDMSEPAALDTHPLVRDWFGERLRQTDPAAWRAAHDRLYRHLRDVTREGETPTPDAVAALYQCITHGCRAGLYQEALDQIYRGRIYHRSGSGESKFQSALTLGAFGNDLSAVSRFFDKPYDEPVTALTAASRSWVFSRAAGCLRAQGRYAEALAAERAGLRMDEKAGDWENATIGASNVSRTELMVGEVAAALASAETGIKYARAGGDPLDLVLGYASRAAALHAAGKREMAEESFVEADRAFAALHPEDPCLHPVAGYFRCDFFLERNEIVEVYDHASRSLGVGQTNAWVMQAALDTLMLGRADVAVKLLSPAARFRIEESLPRRPRIGARIEEAVDALRHACNNDFVSLGLLARAAFRRLVGDWAAAARDLDEVGESARPASMRLYLCDMELERARLALARSEAYAPLKGLVDSGLPKPAMPDAVERDSLRAEASTQLASAADAIAKCGYHRRDEELAELQAVLRSEKKFSDLPPRV